MSLSRPLAWLSLLVTVSGLLALAPPGVVATPAAPQDAESPVPAPAPVVDATPGIAGLAWMSGRWVIEGPGQYLEESWGVPRGDALVGTFRWSRDGALWLYELMSVEQDEDAVPVFRLRHFSRQLEPWESEADAAMTYPLAESGPGRVVFENPQRDDPRRFVYERAGDQLTISLEQADPEAPAEAFTFTLAQD